MYVYVYDMSVCQISHALSSSGLLPTSVKVTYRFVSSPYHPHQFWGTPSFVFPWGLVCEDDHSPQFGGAKVKNKRSYSSSPPWHVQVQ